MTEQRTITITLSIPKGFSKSPIKFFVQMFEYIPLFGIAFDILAVVDSNDDNVAQVKGASL